MIDCRPKGEYDEEVGYGDIAVVTKERGRGIPRTNIERVAEHYGISLEAAEYWLTIHPVDMLLPERGTGIEIGTAARLVDKMHIGFTGYGENPMVDSISELLTVGKVAKEGHIGSRWFNKAPEGDNLPFSSPVMADGNTIEIEIDGVNDTPKAQQMGMRIVVTRPDGTSKASGLDWELWPYTGGYGTHHFIFDDFIAIDQEGNYTIDIELWED